MIVKNLRRDRSHGKVRLSADVVHETAPVPAIVIFFEVEERHEGMLADTYDPFLVAAFLPAILHREQRVLVEGDVAPLLIAGLRCVMAWHRAWFGERHAPIPIEAGTRSESLPERGAVMFLSGGVDSLFTLRSNHLWYLPSHPCRIRNALLVEGFDVRRPDAVRIARERAGMIAAEADLELVVVKSNVPILDDDYDFWTLQFGGAAFFSTAHALTPAFQHAWYSANMPIADLFPWSVHPATDPNFSSAELAIVQYGVEFTRLEKVRLVADWDVALRHLRVCTRNPVGTLNCGECEKCIRTQLELLVANRLADASTFPYDDLTASQVSAVRIRNQGQRCDEAALVPALRSIGRTDLADAVDSNLREYERWEAWRQGTRLRHRVSRALGLRR